MKSPEQSAKYNPSQQQRHKNDVIARRSDALIVNCNQTPHPTTISQLPTLSRQMPTG